MSEVNRQALEHYERGLQLMWKGEVDAAIAEYDRAASEETTDELRELITIRKAGALIAVDREGAEVSALPGIVLRRRSPEHVYHASSALMRKFSEREDDRKRALFYGEMARTAANELGEAYPRVHSLNGLGVIRVIESQFSRAIELFDQALAVIALAPAGDDRLLCMRHILLGNLGGAKVLSGDTDEGIRMLRAALPHMDEDYLVAEVCLDLCFGYIEKDEYEAAEMFGRRAMELAAIPRQVRNANHFLGEICVRTNRYTEADQYFEVVAGYYPDFKNVKQLLVAVDLCAVVNWKA